MNDLGRRIDNTEFLLSKLRAREEYLNVVAQRGVEACLDDVRASIAKHDLELTKLTLLKLSQGLGK